jgi:mannose-6-phosphate isomerase-like protein (cupin superfamily)
MSLIDASTPGGTRAPLPSMERSPRVVVRIMVAWMTAFSTQSSQGGPPVTEPRVLRFEETDWHDRGTGVKSRVLVSRKIGSENLTNGVTVFPPNSKIAVHWHNCDESVVILEGEAICEIDDKQYPMGRLDTTFVPANVPHRFLNLTSREMSILWTYAAGHVTRTFAETGVTVEHMSEGDKAAAATR